MKQFPKNFIWGSATSSFQIEGAWLEGGKGLSIWDVFGHTPGKVVNGDTGDVACDHYHRFKENVALMAAMKLPAYRFSIAWPRIQPTGYGPPNPEGIAFYSKLIDALLDKGITPWVTLYHWDLPAALEFEHHGWLNPKLAEFFRDYAGICFEHFGDRVKNWMTLNEPRVVSVHGYTEGYFPPGRTSQAEPYVAGHHLLRAHAYAVDLYRRKYQAKQKGQIGMVCNCDWREPATGSEQDREAAQRAVEFFLGWFGDPLYRGDYPDSMRSRVADRLPKFSAADAALLKGSADFFGLNHYSTQLAHDARSTVSGPGELPDGPNDQGVVLTADPTWPRTDMGWTIVPWAIRKLLHWVDKRYARPRIVIAENGCSFLDPVKNGAVNDARRIAFLTDYIGECHQAISEGVNLAGYFLWSLMDNFEWAYGYTQRFGIHHVDFQSETRIAKASAKWYADVIRRNGLD